MGLDCSHDAWHGAYSAFHRWRCAVAKAAGLPPLPLMQGFYAPQRPHGDYSGSTPTIYLGRASDDDLVRSSLATIEESLPIRWDCLKPSALHELLYHSDCDGEIHYKRCGPIADALEEVLPKMPDGEDGGHIGNWKDKTATFIAGLRKAAKARQNLKFH